MNETLKELEDAYLNAENEMMYCADNDYSMLGAFLILMGRIQKILQKNGIEHTPELSL